VFILGSDEALESEDEGVHLRQRNQIYIINLDETVLQLRRATEFLQEVTRRGGRILFVGLQETGAGSDKGGCFGFAVSFTSISVGWVAH